MLLNKILGAVFLVFAGILFLSLYMLGQKEKYRFALEFLIALVLIYLGLKLLN